MQIIIISISLYLIVAIGLFVSCIVYARKQQLNQYLKENIYRPIIICLFWPISLLIFAITK